LPTRATRTRRFAMRRLSAFLTQVVLPVGAAAADPVAPVK
jgi:hypothetical protein